MINMEEENKYMEKITRNLNNAMGINLEEESEEFKSRKIEDMIW